MSLRARSDLLAQGEGKQTGRGTRVPPGKGWLGARRVNKRFNTVGEAARNENRDRPRNERIKSAINLLNRPSNLPWKNKSRTRETR